MQEVVITVAGSAASFAIIAKIAWQQLDNRIKALEDDHVSKGWVDRRSESVDKQLDLKENTEACAIHRESILARISVVEDNLEQQRIENKDDHKAILMALDSFTTELAENTKCLHLLAAGGDCR